MSRRSDLIRFYTVVDRLARHLGGARALRDFSGRSNLPHRGVYLFFEQGEERRESGTGSRIVRVGTHALTENSRSTLSQRLKQHRGKRSGGGNHRGSIFRLLVGEALLATDGLGPCPSWGRKPDAASAADALRIDRKALTQAEEPVEQAVTKCLGAMSFLWLDIGDEAGSRSLRGVIERNAIALLSNHERPPLDSPSPSWLGHRSGRPLVRSSGLWNQRHVNERHDPAFLDVLESIVEQTTAGS